MEPVSLDELLAGVSIRKLVSAGFLPTVTGVCIDSRRVQSGDLFFALKGERSDGHKYVAQAFASGALAAVVSEMPEGEPNGAIVLVEDTVRSLGEIARSYRRRFHIPVIGITGSVGKTSVKEMSAVVLGTKYRTHASDKNFNTEIGVPLTLFGLKSEHEAAIIEMGMRGPGEIGWLAEIAEPTIGLVTNIGHAHVELLGSREGIALAKSELLARLPGNGVAILPRHDEYFELLRSTVPTNTKIVTFSDNPALNADVTTYDGPGYYLASVRGERCKGTLRAVGEHHYRNAASALALAAALEIPIPQAMEALSEWTGAEGRLVVRSLANEITLLDDCYNAGPESMHSALATLMRMTNGGGVTVLGDMRELGESGPDLHRRVGAAVAAARPRMLVTVGELARQIAIGAENELLALGEKFAVDYPMGLLHYGDSDEAALRLPEHIRPGDTILVKGSRAMEMEKIVAALTGERGAPHD